MHTLLTFAHRHQSFLKNERQKPFQLEMKGVKIWFECSHELKVEFDILPQALLRLTQALTLMRLTPLLDWGLGPTEHSILSRVPLSPLLELPHPG